MAQHESCRWRSLPHDFSKRQNCYKHYAVWKQKGADGKSILDKVLEELVMPERIINGRGSKPTLSIIDAKSVKNTFTAEKKDTMQAKKFQE